MATKRIQDLQVVDPILTEIAQGYSNNAFISEHILPVVDVDKEVGKIPVYGKGNFIVTNTERGLRADSNRIDMENRTMTDYSLAEYDVEVAIDYREKAAATEQDLEAEATETTMDVILLNQEKKAADLVQNAASYAAGHSEVLAAGNEFNDPDSDPIAIIGDASSTVRGKIAKRPNILLLSDDSYQALRNHPKLLELIKYSATGILTDELLKAIFRMDEIIVGESVYVNDDGEFVDLWQGSAIVLYAPRKETQSVRNPAFGYTLRKRGNPVTDKRDYNGKITLVRSTSIYQHKIVGAEAAYLIKGTVAA